MLVAMLLAGCQQLPLTPQDIQARRFEPVPGQAVIYVVRDYPDFSEIQSTIYLGDKLSLKTYPGTYYRWEVTPGAHRITGHDTDFGTISLVTEPGRIHFVEQQLSYRYDISYFMLVDELGGRAAVRRAVLLKGN
jgi:hypothetical protein